MGPKGWWPPSDPCLTDQKESLNWKAQTLPKISHGGRGSLAAISLAFAPQMGFQVHG